eukprot:GILI01021787.1.p1 GENE.GILI01021787.1~~GILI01021787.1.p1  ORF type:complete len:524 (-),score=122.12 GILI01021787.1:33-1604(-)
MLGALLRAGGIFCHRSPKFVQIPLLSLFRPVIVRGSTNCHFSSSSKSSSPSSSSRPKSPSFKQHSSFKPSPSNCPLSEYFKAIQSNDVDSVMRVLQKGVDINAPLNYFGDRALTYAALKGDLQMVRALVQQGADVNVTTLNNYSNTALYNAAHHGHSRIIRVLTKVQGINLNPVNGLGHSPLTAAASRGWSEAVEELLVAGADANFHRMDDFGKTALMEASANNHLAVVQMLVSVPGVNLDALNKAKETALVNAIQKKNAEIVSVLLSAGARQIVEGICINPLAMAAQIGDMSVFDILMSPPPPSFSTTAPNTPDLNEFCGHISNPLLTAVYHNRVEMVYKLLQAGADVNVFNRDSFKRSPLHNAAMKGHTEIVDLLLQVPEIDINGADASGQTALSLAASKGFFLICEKLVNAGAEVNKVLDEPQRRTALLMAATFGQTPIVQFLLSRAADPNVCDANGTTPLFFAIKSRKPLLVSCLLKSGADVNASAPAPGDSAVSSPLAYSQKLGFKPVVDILVAAGAK